MGNWFRFIFRPVPLHREHELAPIPPRGIKESPPFFHDGRLLTLEDTVEFFNLIRELKLAPDEKKDLVAFMRQL